jgi:hypothetical protein
MESTWDDNPETDDIPHAWAGSHAKPRHTLRLIFANGVDWQGYPYALYEGFQLVSGMLKIYFTNATIVCVGQRLEPLALLVGNEAAEYIREEHKSPFALTAGESFIERIEIKPPNPDALARKP